MSMKDLLSSDNLNGSRKPFYPTASEKRTLPTLAFRRHFCKLAGFLLVTSLFLFGCGGGSSQSGSPLVNAGGSGGGTPGKATLSWDSPTANADGTPLTDLAGFKVYYGTSSGNYNNFIDVGNVSSYTLDNIPPGTTTYFAITAYDTEGNESIFSNETNKVS